MSSDPVRRRAAPVRDTYTFDVRLAEVTRREWACWGASLPDRRPGGVLPAKVVIPLAEPDFQKEREAVVEDCVSRSLPGPDGKAGPMPGVDDPSLERLLYLEPFVEDAGKLGRKAQTCVTVPEPDSSPAADARKYRAGAVRF